MYTTYLFLSYQWAKNFSTFSISFFWVKMVNHYEVYEMILDIEHQLQENVLYHYLHYSFFGKFLTRLSVTLTHLKPAKDNFWDIAHSYKFFLKKILLKIWWFFIFIVIFHVFVISFHMSMIIMAYSTLIPIFTINNISISVHRSIFLLFLRQLALLILVQLENR